MTRVVEALTAEQAESLEAAFLGGLEEAQVAYERIVEHEAWTLLGFYSFRDWWAERVQPMMRALSMRPTREIAAAVVERVREEEAELPPAQRRTQRELADMVGISAKTLQRQNQDPPQGTLSATPDLENDEANADMQLPAGQIFADAFAAEMDKQLGKAMERKAAVEEHNAHVADIRKDITPEREAAILEAVRPAVEFAQLVDACLQFVEMLARIDLAAASRGFNADKALPLQQVLDLLPTLRALEARA